MFTDPNTLEQEEFVETQYYKELDSIDKQHYATGSGFIKVVSEKSEEEYALQLPGAEENINGGYRKMGREKTTKMLKIMGGVEEIVGNTLTAYKAAHDRFDLDLRLFGECVLLRMPTPTYWSYDDQKGIFTLDRKSSSDSFDSSFKSFSEILDSSVKWATIASIVSGVVITVAIVAIVFAIIDCLKKTGSAIPMYARIATNEKMKATEQPLTSDSVAVAIPPNYPLIMDSQVQGATEERILCNIAREKPIAFSRQEIEENSPKTIPNWVLVLLESWFKESSQMDGKWLSSCFTITRT
ncbi:unnamed protein product [Ilex paraguariensis]|uniref:Uncharacterized protein n=1 Tax=Ilex paraguariensis TaxID=185542 RepID=A0ABC8TFD2_9AQUA